MSPGGMLGHLGGAGPGRAGLSSGGVHGNSSEQGRRSIGPVQCAWVTVK